MIFNNSYIVTKEVMFPVQFVCQQDYGKKYSMVFVKPGGRV